MLQFRQCETVPQMTNHLKKTKYDEKTLHRIKNTQKAMSQRDDI